MFFGKESSLKYLIMTKKLCLHLEGKYICLQNKYTSFISKSVIKEDKRCYFNRKRLAHAKQILPEKYFF